MADLRVKSTGKEFRRIDNGTALLLEEMFPEALERVNQTQPGDLLNRTIEFARIGAKPKWGLFTAPTTGEVAIQATTARETMYFRGKPEAVYGFVVGGETAPPEVIAAYEAACANRSPLEQWRANQES